MELQDLLSSDMLAFVTDNEDAGERHRWSADGDTDCIDELFLAAYEANTFDLSHPFHDVPDGASVSAGGLVPVPRPSPASVQASAIPQTTSSSNQPQLNAPKPFFTPPFTFNSCQSVAININNS